MTDVPALLSDEALEKQIEASEPLAKGTGREVYELEGDKTVVLKKQIGLFPGANIQEWHVWCAVKDTELESLFGECHQISETGRFLVMERLEDVSYEDVKTSILQKLPSWLTDKKPSAFGRAAGGSIKVRDYGCINLHVAFRVVKRDELHVPFDWGIVPTTD